jgi:hypothetical protein
MIFRSRSVKATRFKSFGGVMVALLRSAYAVPVHHPQRLNPNGNKCSLPDLCREDGAERKAPIVPLPERAVGAPRISWEETRGSFNDPISFPVKLPCVGRFCQFGRANAPMIPQTVQTMRGPKVGTGTSSAK